MLTSRKIMKITMKVIEEIIKITLNEKKSKINATAK